MDAVHVLWLSQEDIIAAGGLDMAAAMNDIEEVCRQHATGDYVLPGKIVLHWSDPPSEDREPHVNFMPAYVGGSYEIVGLKIVASILQFSSKTRFFSNEIS